MKINMAAEDYFNIGMVVSCETCHGQKIQGEVIAFDYSTKVLVLKSPSSGKPGLHDMRLLNLSFVSEVKVLKEATESPPVLKSLNLQKLNTRLKQSLDEKMRQVNYIGIDVSKEAQNLFYAITKTINDVRWDGDIIVVMNEIQVHSPYRTENCKGKEPALNHVRKIIEKYYRDQDREPSPSSSTSSS